MIDLAAQTAAVVARLTAHGIRAVSDLRDLNPPAVYVAAPTITYRFGKGAADLEWRIVAAAPNTGRNTVLANLSELLEQIAAALRGAVTVARPVDVTALDGGAPLPAYELTFTTPVRTNAAPTPPPAQGEPVLADPPPEAGRAPNSFTLGNQYRTLIPGTITAGRHYRVDYDHIVTRIIKVWTIDGTLLAASHPTVETAGTDGWVTADFPTPVHVDALTDLVVSLDVSGAAISTFFLGPVLHPTHAQHTFGRYGDPGESFPPNPQAEVNRFIDFVWTPDLRERN